MFIKLLLKILTSQQNNIIKKLAQNKVFCCFCLIITGSQIIGRDQVQIDWDALHLNYVDFIIHLIFMSVFLIRTKMVFNNKCFSYILFM